MIAKKRTSSKVNKTNKPILVKCGNHFINPKDVSRISKVEKGLKVLFAVHFISCPNPAFTCWVRGEEIVTLLNEFNIKLQDVETGNDDINYEDVF